jgi:hypothetical protein
LKYLYIIFQISEKDQSLLEERIRRAGKTKVAAEPVKPTNQPVKKSSDSSAPAEKKSSKPAILQTKYVFIVNIFIFDDSSEFGK